MSAVAAAEAEDDGARGPDRQLLRRLGAFLLPYRARVALAVLVLVAASGLELVEPFLTKLAIDRYIGGGDPAGLVTVAAAYLGLLATVFVLRYVEEYLAATIGQAVSLDLRSRLFRHLQALPVRYFDRTPVGRLLTRIVGDVDSLNELFSSGVVAVFGDLFMLVGIVAAMLLLDVRLALVALVVVPPLALVTEIFRRRARVAFREVRGKLARVNAFLQERITGMDVVQLYRREEVDRSLFSAINAAHRDAHLRTVFYYAIYYPVIEVLGACAIGLLLWRGGVLLGREELTLGVLVAFLQYAKRFFQPIMDLSEKYGILQSAMAAAERVFGLLDEPAEPRTAPSAVRPLPAGRPAIELDRVWFAYRGEDWVLRDVSLTVRSGETVAVVGATGAGKSTLASLVLRFHDVNRGNVRLGGVDLRSLDTTAMRRRIAYVQQDVFLFSGSLLDNLRLGGDLPPERVLAAARAVQVDRFAARLRGGYDADVRERGNLLSTGQKQLVALARALAFDPDVLILDEATASVDSQTEGLLQDAITRLAHGRTTLIIAHRLSTVRSADRIVVLHRGQVRESGSHGELMQQGGLYRRLIELQFGVLGGGERGGELVS